MKLAVASHCFFFALIRCQRFSAMLLKYQMNKTHQIKSICVISCDWNSLSHINLYFLEGQKQAIRLARRVNQQTKKMKNAISKYNAQLSLIKEHVNLPQKPVTFEDAKNPNGSIYSNFTDNGSWKDRVPFSQKRRIIELADLKSRCDEEEDLLRVESKAFMNSKVALINALTEQVQHLRSSNDDEVSAGLAALLKRNCLVLQKELLMDKWVFEKFDMQIPEELSNPTYEFLIDIKLSDREEDGVESDSDLSDFDSDYDSFIDNVGLLFL